MARRCVRKVEERAHREHRRIASRRHIARAFNRTSRADAMSPKTGGRAPRRANAGREESGGNSTVTVDGARRAMHLDDDRSRGASGDDSGELIDSNGESVGISRGPYASIRDAVNALREVSRRDGREIVYDASRRGGKQVILCCACDAVPREGLRGDKRNGFVPIEPRRCGYHADVRHRILVRGSGEKAFFILEYTPHNAATCVSVPLRRVERIDANPEFRRIMDEKLRVGGCIKGRDVQEVVASLFDVELPENQANRLKRRILARMTSDARESLRPNS